jgi:hypothetical protein
MQVFIIGSPLETAEALDRKRLNKQIIECQQILNAIDGKTKAWVNHPCTVQYKNNKEWFINYLNTLIHYRRYITLNDTFYLEAASICNCCANKLIPLFHTQEYFDNMKRRLYTKDHNHYKQFEILGESYENWYWVDNKWKIYKQK